MKYGLRVNFAFFQEDGYRAAKIKVLNKILFFILPGKEIH